MQPTRATAPLRLAPPHCPNPGCRHFHDPRGRWWKRIGSFRRPATGARVPRGRCRHCGRSFSRATFEATYWLRRRELLVRIAAESVSGSSLRQIAALVGVHPATVTRHVQRAGRLALLQQEAMTQHLTVNEPIVVDGFETFELSHYHPCHYNLAVGQSSWFVYRFTDSPLRRKGRMTQRQRRRRAELEARFGRPDPKAVERGVRELIDWLAVRSPETLALHSDAHPAYPRAIAGVRRARPKTAITHHRIPSTLARTARNPLFAVNLADLLIRHHGANHKRETIAFDKRRATGLLRLAIWTLWRNFIKPRREKRPGPTTAMAAGLATRPYRWPELLRERRFPERIGLSGCWARYYRQAVRTLALGPHQREFTARFAF